MSEHAPQAPTPEPGPAPTSDSPERGVSPISTETLVESELLVEDVSIDGMCGVY